MEYYINDTNIHIVDSYKICKKEFETILNNMRRIFTNQVLENRSNYSLRMEWATHNFLYNMNFEKLRTKDADLNYPLKWYENIIYNLIGPICWLFIK